MLISLPGNEVMISGRRAPERRGVQRRTGKGNR
jgi:hypothetical protein